METALHDAIDSVRVAAPAANAAAGPMQAVAVRVLDVAVVVAVRR